MPSQVPSTPPTTPPAPPAPLTGSSLIAGRWLPTPVNAHAQDQLSTFHAINPDSGDDLPTLFFDAPPADVDRAAWDAWDAFHELSSPAYPPESRAACLERAAQNILDLGDHLIDLASRETGLPPSRLVSERERTINTLRLFAQIIRSGEWAQATIDLGEASRRPTPKPDIRRILRPLGPIAVFGAGNFPLAYSTAGGDTASALAAGCPVIVKGHPSHPGTSELLARAIAQAIADTRLPPGLFALLQAGGSRQRTIGHELVTHPCVRAVGFTGSFAGGTALAALAAKRQDPIPVFAEMGSTNPVFLCPGALHAQAEPIAERLYSSATNSTGQMCTCPGLVFLLRGPDGEVMLRHLADAMNKAEPQPMLSPTVRALFAQRLADVLAVKGLEVRGGSVQAAHRTAEDAATHTQGQSVLASPVLFRTNFQTFKSSPTLHEEVFGPALIAVACDREEQLVEAAALIHGSLTATIWAVATDTLLAKQLTRVLEQRAGRLVYNGVPTGVEVCAGMVHGGPFPASNQPHTTAVGPYAIHRWCRPVCYQNAPESFLPAELHNANPLGITRLVNGVPTAEPIFIARKNDR